jgi:hypothetical protein
LINLATGSGEVGKLWFVGKLSLRLRESSDAVVDGSEIMKKNYYYRGSNHVLFRYLSYVP